MELLKINGSRLAFQIFARNILMKFINITNYLFRYFTAKIIDLFKKPDLTHSPVRQLWEVEQETDECPDAYMNRLKGIAREAFK